jgi:glucosamine--fructose-6-phosphate aminotransferase (isomerizing)
VKPGEEHGGSNSWKIASYISFVVIAIADWDTPFTTIRIPSLGEMNPCVILIVGWNLLIEIGLEIGIDLDKPGRACKVGNEFLG